MNKFFLFALTLNIRYAIAQKSNAAKSIDSLLYSVQFNANYKPLLNDSSTYEKYSIISENGKYGLANNSDNTINKITYLNFGYLLSNFNPTKTSNVDNPALYKIPYLLNNDSLLLISHKNDIVKIKWDTNNVINPIPLVSNGNEYFIIKNVVSNKYGIMTRNGVIVIYPEYSRILNETFCDMASNSFKAWHSFISKNLYSTYLKYNIITLWPENKLISEERSKYYTSNGNSFAFPFIKIPNKIFIYQEKDNKLCVGVFDLSNNKVVINPIYKTLQFIDYNTINVKTFSGERSVITIK